jgi:hypothetical protein
VPVSLVDLAPTLLSVAGLEIPAQFQGRPLPLAGADPTPTDPRRPLFSEHRLRAAVIVGNSYYARDRRRIEEGERDRISGGKLVPLPTRNARLAAGAPFPSYTPVDRSGPSAPLEAELARFLDATRHRSGVTRDDLPEEAKERLRELGYLE